MKKILTTLFLIVSVCSFANAEKIKNTLMTSSTVVWAGLDYSMVRMVGYETTDASYSFTAPKTIFPGMLEKWNQLFLDERVDAVSAALGKKVLVDIHGVTERNKTASTNQIFLSAHIGDVINEPNITPMNIIDEVRLYKMENTNGLGLVFIVDKLVESSFTARAHSQNCGVVYVVFFDVATRELISAERQVYEVRSGSNFRNFWFGPIKDADSSLIKFQPAKKPLVPITPRSR